MSATQALGLTLLFGPVGLLPVAPALGLAFIAAALVAASIAPGALVVVWLASVALAPLRAGRNHK